MRLPEPTDGFHWTQAAGRPVLACTALAPATHFFTTRAWPLGAQLDAEAGWTDVAEAAGVSGDRLVRLRQVHGAAALVLHRGGVPRLPLPADGQHVEADIIVTDDPDVAIAVQAADCVPLLLRDVRTGAVAAAHAGWRGLAQRVPAIAVDAMARAFGTRPEDVIAAAGPAIGACCYEVGEEVAERFAARNHDRDDLAAWFTRAAVASSRNPAAPGVDVGGRPGHWFFNAWAATRDQLVRAGVARDRIHVAALCTASHAGTFSSYRRHGRGAGRIAAVIRRLR